MEEIVRYIVTSLVENKEEVIVTTENESEKVVIIKVQVHPNDLGKVIGKNGKIATAIRTIVKSASSRSGKKFIIKFS